MSDPYRLTDGQIARMQPQPHRDHVRDWRRVATRYDRCPAVFFPVLALAATVIFWL